MGSRISHDRWPDRGIDQRANEASLACDLFLAIGSSLTVYPAAGFPALAKQNKADLVIINLDKARAKTVGRDHVEEQAEAKIAAYVSLDAPHVPPPPGPAPSNPTR